MKSALLVLVLFAASCSAQIPDEYTTLAGEFTGNYWRTLSFNEKLAFVLGFTSGRTSAAPDNGPSIESARKACLEQFSNPDAQQLAGCLVKSLDAKSDEYKRWERTDPLPGGSFKDTIEAADRFFAEPENRMMSILAAWIVAKWKEEGSTQAEIDSLMDSFRRTYIRAPRTSCEMGFGGLGITAARCVALGTTLKSSPTK